MILAALGLLASATLGVMWLVIKAAVNQEAASVVPGITKSLLEQAKSQLPSDAQPRWEEEWPAGFKAAIEKRPIWALREAFSLYVGARRIARSLEPATAPAGVAGRFGSIRMTAAARFGWLLNQLSKGLEFYRDLFAQFSEQLDRRLPSRSNRRFLLLVVFVEIYLISHGFRLPWE